jgi:hypothetical protein
MELQMHPNGKNYVKTFVCKNVNCSDPVDGSPIPCGLSRREITLCGLQGKYFQEQPTPAVAPAQGNVIQLTKE